MNTENLGTPIFWLISQEKRVVLMEYTWKHYHRKLEIPSLPVYRAPEIPTENLPLEEIDKFMRLKPHSPKKVE